VKKHLTCQEKIPAKADFLSAGKWMKQVLPVSGTVEIKER